MPFHFDDATRLTTTDGALFHGAIHPGWDINGNANGGYLLALAVAAMREASGRPDPITVSAHYLAPGLAGPITVAAEAVKLGRQLATMTGSIRNPERELLRVIGSFGDVAAMSGGFRHTSGGPPELPPIEQCISRQSDGIVHVGLADHLRAAIHPHDAVFESGTKSGSASIAGWMSFVDGRPFDTLSLMLVVDAFPPPVFNIEMPAGWVPTVELTVHVRGIPARGPMRCRFHTEFVQNGFLQEDGEVWDSSDTLVAQSRQLALIPRV